MPQGTPRRQPRTAKSKPLARTDRPFGEELPRLLAERGLSVRSVAQAANISPSHLSRALRGKDYKTPGPRLTRAVAAALALPEDYFPEAREAYVLDRVKSDPPLRDRLYDELSGEDRSLGG